MKTEKGIAREKRKNGEDVPHNYVNSKKAAELIVEAPNRNAVMEELKKHMSARTFRRVMGYVRADDRARERLEEMKP